MTRALDILAKAVVVLFGIAFLAGWGVILVGAWLEDWRAGTCVTGGTILVCIFVWAKERVKEWPNR